MKKLSSLTGGEVKIGLGAVHFTCFHSYCSCICMCMDVF